MTFGDIDDTDFLTDKPDHRNPTPVRETAIGWSASGTITVPIIATPPGIDPQGTVGLQVKFSKPGYHTVQFNVIQNSPAIDDAVLNPLIVRPQAEIIWSVAGNSIRRVIDITDGSSVSGTGEALNITVTDNSFSPAGVTDNEYEYFVSIQVTPGLRPIQGGTQPPAKNAETGFYPGGDVFDAGGVFFINNAAVPPALSDNTTIIVPQNVGINSFFLNISVQAGHPTPKNGELVIVQDGGAPGAAQFLMISNYDAMNRWTPMSPGTKFITIFNQYELSNPSHVIGSILFGVEG